MHALATTRLSRRLTLFISVLLLAGCGKGDGPQSIPGTPATPLPDLPPGYCDPINFEVLCAPPTIINFNGGATTIIDNPDASGINDSEKVAQMQKFPDEVFGGTKFELADAIDFAAGEAYKIKIWSPRSVVVLFKLEETGNPAAGFAQEVSHSGSSSWEELCFDFAGQAVPPPVQALTIIFDNGTMGAADTDPGNWTFYYDDIEQVDGCEGAVGKVPATLPVDFEANPLSYDFSDFDGGVASVEANPDMAGINTSPQVAQYRKFSGEVWAGSLLVMEPVSIVNGNSFTMKVWSQRAVNALLKLEPLDPIVELEVPHGGTGWEELTFAFPSAAGEVDGLTLIFDNGSMGAADTDSANWTFYTDDITLVPPGGSSPTEPAVAAPTPTAPAGNVISLFSDAYADITGVDYNPGWGQATVATQEVIAGSNTLKYAGLDYQGVDFAGNAQDVSATDSLHLDFWSADSTAFSVFLISSGPVEVEHVLTVTPNTWVSVDVPLTVFVGVSLADVIQLKFVGNGTVFVDNLYFVSSGPPPTSPTTAAPTPTEPAANVISLFSDAYTDITGVDYNPGWGQATVFTQEVIAGSNVLKYAGLDYQGTDFSGNAQDVSALTSLHLDFWTADSTALDVFLISPGAETPHTLTVTPFTWVSVDVPLSAFSGVVDLSNVIQLKIVGNGTVFLDNLYFTPAGGGGGPVGDGTFVNGDFETGDFTGWTETPDGGSITIDSSGQGGRAGSVARLIAAGAVAAGAQDVLLSQVNLTEINSVAISGGASVTVSADVFGSLSGAGGVVFIELISRSSGGAETGRSFIGPAPITPTATWTNYSSTVNVAADVSGGITLQLKSSCGPVDGCGVDASYDNVSIVIN